MDRIRTGYPELDTILHGGLPANSINMIVGLPGTGKTILAESLAFHNASPDARVLYVSTVSEPLDKILRYLQDFSFFDPASIGESVFYEDLSDTLRQEGLAAATNRIREMILEYRPAFLVIDSFKALHSYADSAELFRTQLSELAHVLTSLSITSFFVGEYAGDDTWALPEFAVADGIIELVLKKMGTRDQRYLRIIKLRGSDFASGEHAYKITSDGLNIFPRLVANLHPIDYELVAERQQTGVEAVDAMIADGFWKGSSTVVFGPPGSGKTLLSLHFIFKGIEAGEKGMIACMQENPTQLQRIVSGFGWDLQKAIDDGMLELFYVSPVDIYIDEFVKLVIEKAERTGATRVMIDSLNDLEMSSYDPLRFREYMYATVQAMATKGISLIMTNEVRELFAISTVTEYGISHMSDNVILLHYLREESQIKRAISILKTRASTHDQLIRQFTIDKNGLSVGEAFSMQTVFGK